MPIRLRLWSTPLPRNTLGIHTLLNCDATTPILEPRPNISGSAYHARNAPVSSKDATYRTIYDTKMVSSATPSFNSHKTPYPRLYRPSLGNIGTLPNNQPTAPMHYAATRMLETMIYGGTCAGFTRGTRLPSHIWWWCGTTSVEFMSDKGTASNLTPPQSFANRFRNGTKTSFKMKLTLLHLASASK